MAESQVAVLGGGCFWCLEAVFQDLAGVLGVTSGYCGGHVVDPNYAQVCEGDTGHAEVVRIEFDPAVIGFADLLAVFFTIHDPTTPNRQGNDIGPQYRSVIFCQNESQRRTAQTAIAALDASGLWGAPAVTELAGPAVFYPAEDYHHDYFRRNGHQPYCMLVVAPKVTKARQRFGRLLREAAGHRG